MVYGLPFSVINYVAMCTVQARNYIRSLPKMEKKNLHEVFKGANPLGEFSKRLT